MKFEEQIYKFIYERHLIASDDKVLLGVSGGADSVCLFRVLISLCEKFHLCESLTVVHVNHMIRGLEADEDQKFVENLCDRYGVKCYSYRRDVPALSRELGMSEEETGRKVRYELFSEVANAEGCTKIAVAHHKNDLAETVIFNMVRGSGLSGLAGISSARENIIRPLLCVGRQDIETYLDELGQEYKTDSTNNALDYTRNKIRNNLIPVLEELNSEAVEHIVSLAMDAENADRFVEAQAEKIFNRAKLKNCMNKVSPDKNNVSIYLDITMLRQTDSVVLYKLVHNALIKLAGKKKDITRRHIESVVSLIFTDTGKRVMLPYNMSARRSYDILIIERTENIKTDGKIEKNIAFDSLAGGIVAVDLECVPDALSPNSAICPKLEFLRTERPQGDKNFMEKNVYTKIFSYDKILAKNLSGLCIRTKREGDYIVITPDGGTKKLNRVFIDSKVDRKAREIWPLIALGDEILWAVGLRYNEDYRVTEDTKTILKVTYITQV